MSRENHEVDIGCVMADFWEQIRQMASFISVIPLLSNTLNN